MKIIAISRGGFLIDCSKDEIANLCGYYSDNSDFFNLNNIQIGSEIKVHDMFMKLYSLKDTKKEREHSAKVLRELADKIATLPDPFDTVNKLLNEDDLPF